MENRLPETLVGTHELPFSGQSSFCKLYRVDKIQHNWCKMLYMYLPQEN